MANNTYMKYSSMEITHWLKFMILIQNCDQPNGWISPPNIQYTHVKIILSYSHPKTSNY